MHDGDLEAALDAIADIGPEETRDLDAGIPQYQKESRYLRE